jgi:hypothetical protein
MARRQHYRAPETGAAGQHHGRRLASDSSLTFCTGLRLVEAARTAVLRLYPTEQDNFDTVILPRLRAILDARFGITSLDPPQ